MHSHDLAPAEIERRSFAIIDELLADMPAAAALDPDTLPVLRRVIHTTADFDYLDNLHLPPAAVRAGVEALRAGATIVCDTNMALAGVNKRRLHALGGDACCFMADEDVAREAAARGVTRATVSMEYAARLPDPLVFAVGNAPTALLRLHELIADGELRPALVIAVPVGFVQVVESKERFVDGPVPAIVARGRKGGSNVAAAVCNALLALCADA